MFKNITLSAEKDIIHKARLKAQKEHSTLNEQFRNWLKKYIAQDSISQGYKPILEKYDYADSGRSFTRDELNER
jgi:hypothetical protein